MIFAPASDALSFAFASAAAPPLSFVIDLFVRSSAPRCEDGGGDVGTLFLAEASSIRGGSIPSPKEFETVVKWLHHDSLMVFTTLN